MISKPIAGLEGYQSICELAYNRKALPDQNNNHNLTAEIDFLRRNLSSLLLQPIAKSGNRDPTQFRALDAVRGVKVDAMPAEADMEEQNIREQMITEAPDPGAGDFSKAAEHLEIQAVKEAVIEVSVNVLDLENFVQDLPSQFSEHDRSLMLHYLSRVRKSANLVRYRSDSFLQRRKAETDAIKKDRAAAAETLGAAQEKTAAADAKEKELVADAEAFEKNKIMADVKLREAAQMLRAVETREKLVAERERRVTNVEEKEMLEGLLNLGADASIEDGVEAADAVARERGRSSSPVEGIPANAVNEVMADRVGSVVGLDDDPAFEDLNLGADAAVEDAAEAAAAEAREIERLNSPRKTLTPAVESGKTPAGLETPSNIYLAKEHDRWRKETAAAREDRLWHREVILASKEAKIVYGEHRLRGWYSGLCARERSLEEQKRAQMLEVENWKAEVDSFLTDLKVEGKVLGIRNETVIALKDRINAGQAKAWNSVREARLMTGADGGDEADDGRDEDEDGGDEGKDGRDGGEDQNS